MAGLTLEGFDPETFESLKANIYERIRNEFGPVPLDDSTVSGIVVDIFIEAMIKLWEIAEVSYSALDIDKASGAALDALCLLIGVFRRPPTFSTGDVVLTGTPTTPIATGTQLSTGPNGTIVETQADLVIVAEIAWLPSTAYTEGVIRTNAGNVYIANNSGISGASGGPVHDARSTPENPVIILPDNTVNWIWLGAGTGTVVAEMIATDSGVLPIAAYAIIDIETPLTGLSGGTNLIDFTTGSPVQSDAELRSDVEIQIAAPGTGTRKGIRSALAALDEVLQVTIFENKGDVTDADGVPPHSIEALVRGGDDQEIFDAILANIGAGIGMAGTELGTSVDDAGDEQDIRFSRPDEIELYAELDLIVDPNEFPDDGADQVSAAIVALNAQDAGKDAVPAQVEAAAMSITGVLDATAWLDTIVFPVETNWAVSTAYLINAVVKNVDRRYRCITAGTSAATGSGPVTTAADIVDGTAHWRYLGRTIAIAKRELAVFDTTRILATTTDGVP